MGRRLRGITIRVGALVLLGSLVAGAVWVWRANRPNDSSGPSATRAVAPADRPRAAHPDEDFVGSRKCAECHGDIWRSYQSHPMARSAADVRDAEVIEDYVNNTSFSKPASRTYRVERNDNQVWHHESMTDARGGTIYDQRVEVRYVIGSGTRGRTYLIDRGSLLKASPIGWYTEAGVWDLSPGYQPADHPRFDRRVGDECIVCHVGRVSFDRARPNRFDDPPFVEAAIGCERCHGPGAKHVRHHETSDSERDADDPIVNPRDLDSPAREDVCNQCHLLGQRILRHGKSTFDFRPGQRLEDVWTIFPKDTNPLSEESPRAVNQVDQMRQSVCYKSSDGRMGCISCHDPHSAPAADDRRRFFDGRCANCHAQEDCAVPIAERANAPAAGSCIACHMPALPAGNVPHTSQTDHRILRRPSETSPSRPKSSFELYDDAEKRLPAIDVTRARGIVLSQQNVSAEAALANARLEQQLREVLTAYPDDAETRLALATLSLAQRRPEEAKETLRNVLRDQPENEPALRSLARFEQERGNAGEAVEYLMRLQAIDSSSPELHLSLAEMLWQSNRLEEAIAAAEKGLKLDPRLVPLRIWLARAYREAGRIDAAREQDQILERMRRR